MARSLSLQEGIVEGYVDWERAEARRRMVSDNVPASRHHGAPKHGEALLAGLVRCRRCGRKLTVRYTGKEHNISRYSCSRGWLDNGEPRCIAFGGLRVDHAIEEMLLEVVEPGAIAAAVEAEARQVERRDQAARYWSVTLKRRAMRRTRLPPIRCHRSRQPSGGCGTGDTVERSARRRYRHRGEDRRA